MYISPDSLDFKRFKCFFSVLYCIVTVINLCRCTVFLCIIIVLEHLFTIAVTTKNLLLCENPIHIAVLPLDCSYYTIFPMALVFTPFIRRKFIRTIHITNRHQLIDISVLNLRDTEFILSHWSEHFHCSFEL